VNIRSLRSSGLRQNPLFYLIEYQWPLASPCGDVTLSAACLSSITQSTVFDYHYGRDLIRSLMVSAMQQSKFLLSSERLGFRLIEDTDVENLKALDMNPEVRAHFPDGVLTPHQIEERISKNRTAYQENGFGDFAVIELDTGTFAGRAGFGLIEGGEIEVGYVFLKDFWGRGLAQESLRALLDWAEQNLDVPRILAYAPTQHSASFNVMKKCGMRYFKTDRMRGVDCDFYEYPL